MKLRLVVMLALCWLSSQSKAQLFDLTKVSRADSLRGALTPLRTCYDVKYYHLDVRISPTDKTVIGSNKIVFEVKESFNKLQIDLFQNMDISKIVHKGKALNFTREFGAVFVSFPQMLPLNAVEEIEVFYGGKPTVAERAPWDGGFVWAKDNKGNPWVGVACQGVGASLWWPNKDHLSDEPDSMLISVTVPEGLMNISNGRLRGKTDSAGWSKWNWFVSNPINNYNVTVNIGKYEHWSDFHINGKDTLTLDYYVLPVNLEKSKKQFQQVKPMLNCFEKYLGKYPFYEDGFKLIETNYLGMEHQSAVAYGNNYKPGYDGKDISRIGLDFDFIIIHEAGHEWWGNNVSFADAADMWISEGFCTYSESFYVECLYGAEVAKKYINAKKPFIKNIAPIQGVYGLNMEGNGEMYDKGSLMLHTLRNVINNDSLWFDIVKGIQTEFALKSILAQDLILYINKRTGKDYQYFFDHYLKKPNIPQLEVKFEQKGKGKLMKYRWSGVNEDFKMPVKVTLNTPHKFESIQPEANWKEIEVKVEKSHFQVAKDLFYIEVKI